jgi:hypothetical protein
MNQSSGTSKSFALALTVIAFASITFIATLASAQDQQMQEKLMAIKQSQAANKQKLAQYTWQETETISLKGEVKDTKVSQVQIGPDGKQQKTLLNDQKADSGGGGRQGRLKQRVVSEKKEEYQEYGQSIGALAKQYTAPDPDRLMQAKAAGNISLQPAGDGLVNIVVKSYLKPNDTLTLTFSEQAKQIATVQVNSYLDDPGDAVSITAQFAQLQDGTNHVDSTLINGVKKKLTVNTQNSNYQKMQ